MTIEGAIVQLQELIDDEGIPFWVKPSLQKIKETIEFEREEHAKTRKSAIRLHGISKEPNESAEMQKLCEEGEE